jgi:hypothetical protein
MFNRNNYCWQHLVADGNLDYLSKSNKQAKIIYKNTVIFLAVG